MPPIRTVFCLAFSTALFLVPPVGRIFAQEPQAGRQPGEFKELEALNASYREQLKAIERRWISDLATLAGKATGSEREAAYRQLFNLAITHDLCSAAMPAAEHYLALTPSSGHEVRALAALVKVLARAEQGDHDQSLADLGRALQETASSASGACRTPTWHSRWENPISSD